MRVVCGTVVRPSWDTNTPETPVDATAPLISDDFLIPRKPRYYLSELAAYVCQVETEPDAQRRSIEAAQRALERECERGNLRGVRIGRNIVVPGAEWERYILDRNTLCDN